ncbi:glycosyltransferase [Bacteroidales bacterium OttesenSCG-928-L03]|nr:glycosyltransferase [Bacteroidales bacterium OttesenSCG-928-L03]
MNILLLTPIYPSSETNPNSTKVVHYFTKEWVALGHNVYVIHNYAKFPFPFYMIPKRIIKKVEAKAGTPILSDPLSNKDYSLDGVSISRISIKKRYPHGDYTKSELRRQYQKIVQKLDDHQFIPDIVIGHWESPQIPLVPQLKKKFNAKSVIVFHGDSYIQKNNKKNIYVDLLKEIDILGFRSITMKRKFETEFWNPQKSFICYSGFPLHLMLSTNEKYISGNLKNILYVGMLIERKYPEVLLNGVNEFNIKTKRNIHLEYIGEGSMKKGLMEMAKKNGMDVLFHNRLDRSEVFKRMQFADCLVMISKNEVFGLVYLEAMYSKCIVIASKGEGMDGIIIDNHNGFLCEAGSQDELVDILIHIDSLSIDEKNRIIENAYQTAIRFTDEKVAKLYLDSIH